MYHLLAQQNNPLNARMSAAIEMVQLANERYGVRPSLELVLKYLDDPQRVPETIDINAQILDHHTHFKLLPKERRVVTHAHLGMDFSAERIGRKALEEDYGYHTHGKLETD
ncbi:hypothetical protein D9_0091 [Aeromonas phage D9]|nr:hypothetical protein D9_0091 [Aeromonas phage D9]